MLTPIKYKYAFKPNVLKKSLSDSKANIPSKILNIPEKLGLFVLVILILASC